jgi:hypothetical protein
MAQQIPVLLAAQLGILLAALPPPHAPTAATRPLRAKQLLKM